MTKICIILSLCFLITSCTLSFKNISTHGSATDLIDEQEENTPNIAPSTDFNLNKV